MNGKTMLILGSAMLIVVAILLLLFWNFVPRGAENIEMKLDYQRLALVATATFVGIISNGIYDRITVGKDAPLFSRTDIVFAAIVAPVVILPIFRSLGSSPDPLIVALTAYQNGFFFNVIFDKLRRGPALAETTP